ncbi:olfactory receptor 6N2-like [Centropristis striata]|uniref:olfactory receptor 6N2-like n=1 Tax=Centropristis striata TaxID=184440 RepID=UPI0027E1F8F6|nr:olfactory receptor 6N2-like [Centropristis striata]XP_059198370.1 olfactory receptor 6N2-like [Centropristis striata]
MENKLNVTFITLGGYVELEKYRYVYFVILFIVYILIICSNYVIVYLICIHQNLHEPMYIFIAALLLNSVLFSSTVYPKLLTDILSDKLKISYSACLFQYHVFYSFGSSEFLLLAAMSYDRYVSICKPLRYPTIMTKTNVNLIIVSAWILPAPQIAVATSLSANEKLCRFTSEGVFCDNTIYKLQCVERKAHILLDMLILLNVAVVPVLFILFTYTRIFLITYRSGREVRKKAAQTCLPHLIVLVNFSCLCLYDVLTGQLNLDFPKTIRLIMSLQMVMYHTLFNPIMYGLQMKEIYKHLKKLFVKTQ